MPTRTSSGSHMNGPSLSELEGGTSADWVTALPASRFGRYPSPAITAGQRYLTSNPVTARPMIIRWISDVPSKMVKIFASRCQRSTG